MVLVGGFGSSDWLYQQVKDKLAGKELTITRPESSLQVFVYLDEVCDSYINSCLAVTRQYPTVPYPFTSTTMFELALPKSHMGVVFTSHTTLKILSISNVPNTDLPTQMAR